MMFHCNLGGILNLTQPHGKQLAKPRRRHGAGRADFRLTTALRPADGGIGLDKIAHHARRCQRPHDGIVRKPVFFLHITQHRRQNATCPAGRGGHHRSAGGVLFRRSKGIGTNQPVFARFRRFVRTVLAKQQFCLALHIQPARQNPLCCQPCRNGFLHLFPHHVQVGKDLRFPYPDIIGQADVFFFAKGADLPETPLGIYLGRIVRRLPFKADCAAADAVNPSYHGRTADRIHGKIHSVGVRQIGCLPVKNNLAPLPQHPPQHCVGSVAVPGQGKRTVKRDTVAGIGVQRPDAARRLFGRHGVRTGRTDPDPI